MDADLSNGKWRFLFEMKLYEFGHVYINHLKGFEHCAVCLFASFLFLVTEKSLKTPI